MNQLTAEQWNRLLPTLREVCPRLTAEDLADCDQRLDLLVGKIQNRHWIDRTAARRTLAAAVTSSGISAA
jgi:hypothetical protein